MKFNFLFNVMIFFSKDVKEVIFYFKGKVGIFFSFIFKGVMGVLFV